MYACADKYEIPFLLATRLGLGPLMAFLSWHGAFHGHFPCLVHYFWSYSDTGTLSRTTDWLKAWQYCLLKTNGWGGLGPTVRKFVNVLFSIQVLWYLYARAGPILARKWLRTREWSWCPSLAAQRLVAKWPAQFNRYPQKQQSIGTESYFKVYSFNFNLPQS